MSDSIITAEIVKNIIERRNREIHKGDCGRVLIAAGSEGMAGAAVLCARGALRSGAGLVQLSIPKDIMTIVQIGVPEATCMMESLENADLSRFSSAAAGCGMGNSEESIQKVKELLNYFSETLVLDADALNIIASQNLFYMLKRRKNHAATVITPHMMEARRLMGEDYRTDMTRRQLAAELADKTGAIVVLKGAGTVVATEDGETYINTTGNPGMATAGSGDVLAGIAASLCGQKNSSGELPETVDAVIAAVYIHGLAGDLAAAELGEHGLVAGDIAYYTAFAMKKISEES